jgi:hypothetical protein
LWRGFIYSLLLWARSIYQRSDSQYGVCAR